MEIKIKVCLLVDNNEKCGAAALIDLDASKEVVEAAMSGFSTGVYRKLKEIKMEKENE